MIPYHLETAINKFAKARYRGDTKEAQALGAKLTETVLPLLLKLWEAADVLPSEHRTYEVDEALHQLDLAAFDPSWFGRGSCTS